MNSKSFTKFLYYSLFYFLAIYIVFIVISYLIDLQNLKYNSSKWKKKTAVVKVINKMIFPEKKVEYIVKSGKQKILLSSMKHKKEFQELNFDDEVKMEIIFREVSLNNKYDMFLYNCYGVDTVGFIKQVYSITPSNKKYFRVVNFLADKIFTIREKLISLVQDNISKPYSDIILRISLGYKLDNKLENLEYFQKAGVMHVLVVSGLHVGFVYLIVFYILKPLVFFNRELKIIVSLVAVVFYTLLSGASAPVVRATIILICFCLANILHREGSPFHTLTFSALILLLINERNLFNSSFQLSFLACFGLIYLYPIIFDIVADKIKNWNSYARYILQLFLITLSTQLFTLPLILIYFNRFSLISFVSNIVVVPLSSILLWSCVAYYSLAFSSWLVIYLSKFLEFFTMIYLKLVEFFAELPFSTINGLSMDWLTVLIYYIVIIFVPLLVKNKRYFFVKLVVILILSSIIFSNVFCRYAFKISFLDVDYGNATLLCTEDNQNILINAAGNYNYDIGRYKIFPFLAKNKIRCLDYVIITHPHFTEYLGLKYLIGNVKIKNLIINDFPSEDLEYKEIISKISRTGTKVFILKKEKKIKFCNGEILLVPNFVKYSTDKVSLCDANSMFIIIRYKGLSCVLTNDLPSEEIIKNFKIHFLGSEKPSILHLTKYDQQEVKIDSLITVLSNGVNKNKKVYFNKGLRFYLDDKDLYIYYKDGKKVDSIKDKGIYTEVIF